MGAWQSCRLGLVRAFSPVAQLTGNAHNVDPGAPAGGRHIVAPGVSLGMGPIRTPEPPQEGGISSRRPLAEAGWQHGPEGLAESGSRVRLSMGVSHQTSAPICRPPAGAQGRFPPFPQAHAWGYDMSPACGGSGTALRPSRRRDPRNRLFHQQRRARREVSPAEGRRWVRSDSQEPAGSGKAGVGRNSRL